MLDNGEKERKEQGQRIINGMSRNNGTKEWKEEN